MTLEQLKEESLVELKKKWKYSKRLDGTLEIIKYKGTETEVFIPSKIGKAIVTHIATPDFGEYVFPQYVKKVIMPESLISIGERVFFPIRDSEQINIPENVLFFYESTFSVNSYPKAIDDRYQKIGKKYYRKNGLVCNDGMIIVDGVLCGAEEIEAQKVWKVPEDVNVQPITNDFPYIYYKEMRNHDAKVDHTLVVDEKNGLIEFGRFPSAYDGTVTPLLWKIVKREGDRLLLITNNVIANVPYNSISKTREWENSELKLWLNGAFYNFTFNEDEKRRIENNIFVLSQDEIVKYYEKAHSLGDEGQKLPTEYAKAQGIYIRPKINSTWWWLRDSVELNTNNALCVDPEGVYVGKGQDVSSREGVCPSIWIDIS